MGNFSYPTYMVGGDKLEGIKAFYPGVPAYPMRKSKNGYGRIGNDFQRGRRY